VDCGERLSSVTAVAASKFLQLELGSDVILTPAERFDSTLPKSLALLACWGARAASRSGDPLTLAAIALARGSRQILVT